MAALSTLLSDVLDLFLCWSKKQNIRADDGESPTLGRLAKLPGLVLPDMMFSVEQFGSSSGRCRLWKTFGYGWVD